jgi:hypothetical protein
LAVKHRLTNGGDRPHRHIRIKGNECLLHYQRIANRDPVPIFRTAQKHLGDDFRSDTGGVAHSDGER